MSMKNIITSFYWKLFFYWTAYNLGEKKDPAIIAVGIVYSSFVIMGGEEIIDNNFGYK